MKDPVVLLERNLYGHPLAGQLWERKFDNVLLEHGWAKVPNWECFFVNREKRLFLSVYVDDVKLAGKKQNIVPLWKVLMKDVDLGEPTSFLDHVYLGCTQREFQSSKDIVDNYRSMFESKISAGATEKLLCSRKPDADISSWSYDMEGHAKKCVERYLGLANQTTQQLYKVATPCVNDHQFISSWSCDMEGQPKECVERYCELTNKTIQQLYKVSTPCIDNHHFKEEELKFVGDLSHVCS